MYKNSPHFLLSPHISPSPPYTSALPGKGADVEELEGVAAAGFTAARVGEAASQVAHDLQVLVQGNAAEDAANDELAEIAAAALIAGRKVSQNAMKALEDRVTRNSNGNIGTSEGIDAYVHILMC
jgi:hypothetical protein